MIKSYKVRLYPTKEQEQLMMKHIGCARFIYNYMLSTQIERHNSGVGYLSRFDMIRIITALKKDGNHEWLYDVSNITLQIACADLDKAYQSFFKKRTKFPKFKSKKGCKQSFPYKKRQIMVRR